MHSRRRTLWVTVFAVHSDDNVLLELYCRDVIISVSMVMFSAPPAPLWTHLLIMFSGSKLISLHCLCYHTASVLLMFEVRVNSLSTRTNKRICHQLRTSRKCDVRIIIVYVWTSFWNLIATHYTSSHQETLLHLLSNCINQSTIPRQGFICQKSFLIMFFFSLEAQNPPPSTSVSLDFIVLIIV